jgi:hypothetical protein
MGFFSPFNEFEKILVQQKIEISLLAGFPEIEAKKMAEESVKISIKESKKNDTYNLPNNLGNIFLGEVRNDDYKIGILLTEFKKRHKWLMADGVKDADIKWWWNLNDVERRLILFDDEAQGLSVFITLLKRGETAENAGIERSKTLPWYEDPSEKYDQNNIHRPIPNELHDRVNNYVMRRMKSDHEKFKKDIEESKTLNGLIRNEIKNGNL